MGEVPPSAHSDGGRTPAGDRAGVSGTRRKPGLQGAAREAPTRARPAAGAAVPDRGGETVAPDTVGTNSAYVCAVGGRTPAPRRRAVSRTDRKAGVHGADREAQPGARPTTRAAASGSSTKIALAEN